jgi:CheY-like chemotaxis protein
MMPRVDGFEFLAALRNSQPHPRAVIFVTTGSSSSHDAVAR